MINKLVVDGQNIILNESTVLPFTYTFSTAGVHTVKVGLDSTNEICAYAFKDCEELTNVVNIPERITMIKRNAFENCTHLEKFNVPSSIEYIGPNVFDGCIALKEIKFNTNTPPQFLSKLSPNTNCFIPDGSKFIKVEDNSTLVKDGSIQYYEKNMLGGYDEVDYEALDDSREYYYDNWTSVHDHYNTIEERYRVNPTQVDFIDNGVVTTLYGDINAGDSGYIFPYRISPENATNHNVYLYSTNENVLNVDQNGYFTTNSNLLGNTNVSVCICTEPDYWGTYAFTQLRFRVRANQQVIDSTFTVTFMDGDEILKTITGPTGTDVSASDIILEKEGYEFNGWSIDGENAILPVDAIIDTNIIYIALWIAIPQNPEGTIETEFDTDENGNAQLINLDNEGTIETEFNTDENGNAQIINTNNE